MGKDRLEDYIKEQLVNHESTVDADAVWNRLQNNKKKKRPFLWLSALGLIIVAGLTGIYLMTQESNKLELENKKTILAENDVLREIDISMDVLSSSQSDRSISSENARNDKASENSVASVVTAKEKGIIKRINGDKQNADSVSIADANDNAVVNASYGLLVTRDLQKYKLNEALINGKVESQATRSIVNSSIENTNITSLLSIDMLDRINSEMLNHQRQMDVLQIEISSPFNKEETMDTWQSYVGVSTAYYKGSRSLRSLDSLDTTLSLRSEGEEFVEAWGVGLEYILEHKSGLFLGTGLAYRQINDRAKLEEQSRELLVPTPIELQGQGVFAEITNVERVRYHKIGMIDIPLFVGYTLKQGRNAFSFRTGININLRTYSRGQIIDSQLQDNGEYGAVLRSVEDEVLFRNRVGWSSQIELGYHRLINDSFELAIKPTFRFYNSAFNDESNNPIEQRYKHFGLKMTLSKRF